MGNDLATDAVPVRLSVHHLPVLAGQPAYVRGSWRHARGGLWTPFRVLGAVESLSNLAVDESRTRGHAHQIRLRQRTVDTRRLDLEVDSRPEG
jgi:hypothetical protein